MIPKTYLSLHQVDRIAAFADNSFSTSLTLHVEGAHGLASITLFMNDVDKGLTQQLADAINAVVAAADVVALVGPAA